MQSTFIKKNQTILKPPKQSQIELLTIWSRNIENKIANTVFKFKFLSIDKFIPRIWLVQEQFWGTKHNIHKTKECKNKNTSDTKRTKKMFH